METSRDAAKQAAIEAAEKDRQENYVKVVLRNHNSDVVYGWLAPQHHNDAHKRQSFEEWWDANQRGIVQPFDDGSDVYCHHVLAGPPRPE